MAESGLREPPLLGEPPAPVAASPILIDASMIEAHTPVETRLDFEHGMSYWQPLTLAIIVVLCVIFGFQLAFDTLSSEEAIVAAGALKRSNILDGELWRLVSAVFLHGSLDHIIGNCLVLYVLGMAVEHAYGRLKFLLIFFFSGISGSVLSCVLSEGPSVGASGAIFGLMGCLIGFFYRHRAEIYFREKRLGGVLLFWVAYSVVTGFLTPFIDNWAHIGGLIGGAAATLFLTPRPSILQATSRL